jgi:hypothetical protein
MISPDAARAASRLRLLVSFARDSHLPGAEQAHRASLDRLCLCRHDARVHVYRIRVSLFPHLLRNNCWRLCIPLQVVRPWVFMFSIRTKGTNVTRRLVDEAMTYHLVLPFEPLSALSPRAAVDRAVVRSALRVNVCVRAIDEISTEAARLHRKCARTIRVLTLTDTEFGMALQYNRHDRIERYP